MYKYDIIVLKKEEVNIMKKEELREIIRKNLIELRNTHDYTQTEIGKKVGKGKTAIASWEQGLSLPDITTLYELSKIYGVSLEYFYEDHTAKIAKVITDYNEQMRENIRSKSPRHRGVARSAADSKPKKPATLNLVVWDDKNKEAKVVKVDASSFIAEEVVAFPASSDTDTIRSKLNSVRNKKEGGTSD